MELVLTESALEDFEALQQYYADQGVPQIGKRFVEDILHASEMLVEHSDSGRKVPEFDEEQIRELIFPPYRVVYLRETSRISIIRIWREERNLTLP